MNKQIKILMVGLLLMMSFVVAQDTDYIYESGKDVTLNINCFNETFALCDSSTACYMTISYPDGTNLVNNGTMTRDVSYYNYSIGASQLNQKGEYSATAYCDNRENGFSSFQFLITSNNSRFPPYVLNLIITIFLFVLFFFGIMKEDVTLTAIASMGLIVVGIFTHINGFGDVKNWITDLWALVNIAIGSYVLIRVTMEEAVNNLNGGN